MDHNLATAVSAVAFDLDGLMLNTEDVFSIAGRQLLSRRGLQMTDEIHHQMLGRRPDEAFSALKRITGIPDSIDSLKNETRTLFYEIAEHHLDVMPGLTDLLQLIESFPLPKAVATSSPRDYMEHLLERFQLLHRFPVTLTAEDVSHGKPHPEIYLTAAKRLDVNPEKMLVLEDSEAGIRAAAAAGAIAVAVPNRHTEAGDFSMAHTVVPSLSAPQIKELLLQRHKPPVS